MVKERVDEILENVERIYGRKESEGFSIEMDLRKISVPLATNFEWRMKGPIKITHMYLGTETGKYKDLSFEISFSSPCTVQISNPDARCYFNLSQNNNGDN